MKLLPAILLTLSLSAHAEFVDGNRLHSWLNGDDAEQLVGKGYVAGVFDAFHGLAHCAPANVALGQVTEMAKIALRTNPSTRHESASVLVLLMLEKYWPCPKKAKTL